MVKKFVGSMCAISLELLLVTTDIFYLFFFWGIPSYTIKKEISLGRLFRLECDRKLYSEVKRYKNDKLIKPHFRSSRIFIKNYRRKSIVKVKNAKNINIGLYKRYGVKNEKKNKSLLIIFFQSQVMYCFIWIEF